MENRNINREELLLLSISGLVGLVLPFTHGQIPMNIMLSLVVDGTQEALYFCQWKKQFKHSSPEKVMGVRRAALNRSRGILAILLSDKNYVLYLIGKGTLSAKYVNCIFSII